MKTNLTQQEKITFLEISLSFANFRLENNILEKVVLYYELLIKEKYDLDFQTIVDGDVNENHLNLESYKLCGFDLRIELAKKAFSLLGFSLKNKYYDLFVLMYDYVLKNKGQGTLKGSVGIICDVEKREELEKENIAKPTSYIILTDNQFKIINDLVLIHYACIANDITGKCFFTVYANNKALKEKLYEISTYDFEILYSYAFIDLDINGISEITELGKTFHKNRLTELSKVS